MCCIIVMHCALHAVGTWWKFRATQVQCQGDSHSPCSGRKVVTSHKRKLKGMFIAFYLKDSQRRPGCILGSVAASPSAPSPQQDAVPSVVLVAELIHAPAVTVHSLTAWHERGSKSCAERLEHGARAGWWGLDIPAGRTVVSKFRAGGHGTVILDCLAICLSEPQPTPLRQAEHPLPCTGTQSLSSRRVVQESDPVPGETCVASAADQKSFILQLLGIAAVINQSALELQDGDSWCGRDGAISSNLHCLSCAF